MISENEKTLTPIIKTHTSEHYKSLESFDAHINKTPTGDLPKPETTHAGIGKNAAKDPANQSKPRPRRGRIDWTKEVKASRLKQNESTGVEVPKNAEPEKQEEKKNVSKQVVKAVKPKPKLKAFYAFGTTYYKEEEDAAKKIRGDKFVKLKWSRQKRRESTTKASVEDKAVEEKERSPELAKVENKKMEEPPKRIIKSTKTMSIIDLHSEKPEDGKKQSKVKLAPSALKKDESSPPPLRNRASIPTCTRTPRSKITKLKEEEEEVQEEATANKQSETKISPSKNKLTAMAEETTKERGTRVRGAYSSSSTGRRAKSPFRTTSETSAKASRVRIEEHTPEKRPAPPPPTPPPPPPPQQQHPEETWREMSFFEKLHMNVRSYFGSRSQDAGKSDEDGRQGHEGGDSPESRRPPRKRVPFSLPTAREISADPSEGHHGDVPQREKSPASTKSIKPEKDHFLPRRSVCFVYSLTETEITERECRQEETTTSGNLRSAEESDATKKQKMSPYCTLNDIISLTRKVFHENENEPDDAGIGYSDNDFAFNLEKLMEEKKNYITMQRKLDLKKIQKGNVFADSFNFFNSLNKDFILVKTSNSSIEQLRKIMMENRISKMDEYLKIYKKLVRTLLTEPEQSLMDEEKMKLEKYAEMYYELMTNICARKDGKTSGREIGKEKTGNAQIVNYYELIKKSMNKKKELPEEGNFISVKKIGPRLDKSTQNEDNRRRAESSADGSGSRLPSPAKRGSDPDGRYQKVGKRVSGIERVKQVHDLMVPSETDTNDDPGRTLLVKVSNHGLIVKNASLENTSMTKTRAESLSKKRSKSEEGKSSRHQQKTESEQRKGPAEEKTESGEFEHPMLKFKAFRKLITEGVKYLNSYEKYPEVGCPDCPKISKGGKVPEICQQPIVYPKIKLHGREWKNHHDKKSCHETAASKFPKRHHLPPKKESVPKVTKGESIVYQKKEGNHRWKAVTSKSSTHPMSTRCRPSWSPPGSSTRKPTTNKVSYPRESRTLVKDSAAKEKIKKESAVDKSTDSSYVTPMSSYLNWETSMKALKNLLSEAKETMATTETVGMETTINEDADEEELRKMDLQCADEKNQNDETQTSQHNSESQITSKSSIERDWDQLLRNDCCRVSDVLNQFMGNISLAWKAALHLKDIIKPKPAEEQRTEEANFGMIDEAKKKGIESFRSFLRILTIIFERNQEEKNVRKDLFLLMKELLLPSPGSELLNGIQDNGSRTPYHKEIARIPRELRELIADALLSKYKDGNGGEEEYEPGMFVVAVKEVGEKLKELQFADESSVPEKEIATEEPRKIYYFPDDETQNSESIEFNSNLKVLEDKIKRMDAERNSKFEDAEDGTKKDRNGEQEISKIIITSDSSIYYDAVDKHQIHDISGYADQVIVDAEGNDYGKYRDLIYDKIIALIKSENPNNFKFGMNLLGKILDGGRTAVKKDEAEEREKKWNGLTAKLTEMCQAIETEMQEQKNLQIRYNAAGKEEELIETCECLKTYVNKLNVLMSEIKDHHTGRESSARVRALEESRNNNMERQLNGGKLPKYTENGLTFIDSIGELGRDSSDNDEDREPINETFLNSMDLKDSFESAFESNKSYVLGLKKSIERKQRRIEEIIERAEKEGFTRKESFREKRIARKLRDLKKCYNLLVRMVCDPTLTPPRNPRTGGERRDKRRRRRRDDYDYDDDDDEEEPDNFRGKIAETDYQVMTVLRDIISGVDDSKFPARSHRSIASEDFDSVGVEGRGRRRGFPVEIRPRTK